MKIPTRLRLHALAVVAITASAILFIGHESTWRSLIVPLLVATVIAAVLASLVARTVTRPMQELQTVTRSLAKGDLSRRPALSARDEIGDLATAIHRLSEQLGERFAALESEDALLTALIESLHEGIVAIGPHHQAVRINEAGRALLGINHRTPFPTDRLPRLPELHTAVQAALDGTATDPVEIVVAGRTLSLTARPLSGGGAVLALFDLTRIRQLELVRSDFVANVSHELRTPLTVVGGFAETLADDDPPVDSRRQFAAAIVSHTRRMQRIVDDLLDLSRIESGGWVPKPTDVDLNALAREVVEAGQNTVSAGPVSMEADIPDNASRVFADRTALRQILSNLVDNAIRHTTAGTVRVFSERDGEGVWVGVADTGEGIAPEHLPRIFERFYRADQGRARHHGGTGLGLAIVRHMTEAHGGRVSARSVMGAGTTISVYFPSRPADA